MNKIAVFILILFFGVAALFAFHNYDTTTFNVPFDKTYEVPKIGLVLFSVFIGAALMLILVVLRDTRRFMNNYKLTKMQKKEERLEGLYSRAINAILANDREEARDLLEGILKEEPNHTNALLRLGDIMAHMGQRGKAVEYYKNALRASGGKSLEALFSMEEQMREMNRWDEALTYTEEILEIDADNLSALGRKSSTLERLERWADLVEVQKSVLKHQHLPDQKAEEARLHGYRYEYAKQSLEANDLDRAGKIFRSVLRYDKEFIPAYLGAAEVLLHEGEGEQAVEFLERGYDQTGSIIILARLEDLLINLGEPDRIIKLYQTAILRRPGEPVLKFLLGKLYYRLEMVDDALEILKGFDSAESYQPLYTLLGELYMRREHYKEAARAFRKAMDITPWNLFYSCKSCGHLSAEWSGRCPGCGQWNTYSFDLYGRSKL
ncbi:MAG: tetratricopeptide repeat protein [Nitrospiraceae bacterium]|nr:tetratricopeptide repeat protein [Nitrospiraceae bacterium]